MKNKAIFKSLILSIALVLCFTLMFVSCGGGETPNPSSSAPAQSNTDTTGGGTVNSTPTTDNSVPTTDSSTPSTDSSVPSTDSSVPSTDSSNPDVDPPVDVPCEHNFVSVSKTDATCKDAGEENFECSLCGETKTETIPKTENHTYTVVDEIEATCQSPKIIVKECSVCQDRQEVEEGGTAAHIPSTVVTLEPTCTTEGAQKCACSTCGADLYFPDFEKVIPALGHDEQYEVVAPTCVKDGITNITCTRCDYTSTKDPTDATGVHVYDVKGETVAPTCLEQGYTTYICSAGECGTTENKDFVDALGHDEKYEVVAPTCIKNGVTNITCTRCDYTSTKDEVAATGNHVLEYKKTVKPTCIEVGHKLYACTVDPECTVVWKNPDLSTPNEPLPEDIVPTIDHGYAEATIDGWLACYMCGKGYRDVTTEKVSGDETFCMGCGKDPCECGSTGEWDAYGPAKAPYDLTADTEFAITEVALSGGNVALQIGNGMIVLTGESETTYTVEIYGEVENEVLHVFEVTGDYVLVNLEGYDNVCKVLVVASTAGTVQFYAPEN